MPRNNHVIALCALAVCAANMPSQAQTPNPLVRPAAQESTLSTTPGAPGFVSGQDARARVPQARPVPDGMGGSGSPMPGSLGGSPGSNGLTPHANPEVLVRDELAQYAVTAIMDQVAVLRLVSASGTRQGTDTTSNGNSRSQGSVQPQVIRVTSGTPVTIGGATLVPQVSMSYVDFFMQVGRAAVATVALESAAQKYTPDVRETVDQGYAARLSPSRTSNSSGTAGVSGQGNGTAPTGSIR